MSKHKPTSNVSDRSKRRGRPGRAWPERIDADPEEVMRVLIRTPRSEVREEPAEYKAEKPERS